MPGGFKIAEAYADARTDISKFSAGLAKARGEMQTTREHMSLIGRSSLRMFSGLTNAVNTSVRRARDAAGSVRNARVALGGKRDADIGRSFNIAGNAGSVLPNLVRPAPGILNALKAAQMVGAERADRKAARPPDATAWQQPQRTALNVGPLDTPTAPRRREDRLVELIQKQLDENRLQNEILKAVLNLMKKQGVVVGVAGE
jgi:hypothetical protein